MHVINDHMKNETERRLLEEAIIASRRSLTDKDKDMTRKSLAEVDGSLTTAIYELQIITCESGKTSYPLRTSSRIIGLFPRLELAEDEMRKVIIKTGGEFIHHFTIRTRHLDTAQSSYDDCERRIYDLAGVLHGVRLPETEPFAGKKAEECRFKEGEIVEVAQNGLLKPGIISLMPITPDIASKLLSCDQTDNVYCVEFVSKGRSHDHLPECDLFRPRLPVSATTRAKLLRIYKQLKPS